MKSWSGSLWPSGVTGMGSRYTGLFAEVREMAAETGSLYNGSHVTDRDALLCFLDANAWFDLEPGRSLKESVTAEGRIRFWLRAYKKSGRDKTDLILGLFREKYPATARRLRSFLSDSGNTAYTQGWKFMDFLLSYIDREIVLYPEGDLRNLVEEANRYLSLADMKLLTAFLRSGGRKCLSPWEYEFRSRQVVKTDSTSYPLRDFGIMAYTIFNPEAWEKEKLVEKAAGKRRYADLWLFMALHFVSGIRTTDMERLPVPDLPFPPDEMRRKILGKEADPAMLRGIAQEVQFRQEMLSRKPHKVRRHGLVTDVKFFIPESLLEPMGLIIALSVSFREKGDPFVRTACELQDVHRFFGEGFAAALGNRKRFSSRRANKAYLQGIGLVSEDRPGYPKGYMLAALARSHKGGIGTLPEITDVYLKDANFTGYSPEFILREMFERGVFGFIPVKLLEMYREEVFSSLDVCAQTELIRAVGLSAWQIEMVASAVSASLRNTERIVEGLFRNGSREHLADSLQRIASGAAPGKQGGMLCVRMAAGYSCDHAERSCCIGCGYEIYTKTATHLLVKEYVRLSREKRPGTGMEAEKNRMILEHKVVPAILQVICSIPELYPDADMGMIREMVEGGIRDADRIGC